MPRAAGSGLDAAARELVARAIAAAERGTSGEIRVVLATRPLMNAHVYPLLWAALAALALPWLFILARPVPVIALFGAQILLFALAALLLTRPALSRAVTPLRAREHAVRETALTQFLALGIHETRERTGILVLVAMADRVVEVGADEKIHGRVGHDAWRAVAAAIIEGGRSGRLPEGIAEGVAVAGRVLAAHFPPGPDPRNELPDHLVVV